ncbi:hypothetical protein GGX14DRAFT_602671 [Mycena pura]|uniref:Uncharacterized protein n=1 Tax=Mycena pura TaxID=153505 RepID=A0AAD6VM79_9AGAR|nr:hypothetical protein GGX14DRAFT_602671 [Mycena pura]
MCLKQGEPRQPRQRPARTTSQRWGRNSRGRRWHSRKEALCHRQPFPVEHRRSSVRSSATGGSLPVDVIEFRRDLGAGRRMNPPQPRGTTVTRKGMARARRGGPGGVTTGWGEVDTAETARCFDGVCSGGRCSRTGDHDNRQGGRAFGAFGRSTSDGTWTRNVADRQNRTKEDTGGRQKRQPSREAVLLSKPECGCAEPPWSVCRENPDMS